MNLLLLQPRLDCSFKEGAVPKTKGKPNHPLRRYWEIFFAALHGYCKNNGHHLDVVELPLWQFSPEWLEEYVRDKSNIWDFVFIPHKGQNNFPVTNNYPKPLYYMQQALPWLFSIDPYGWQSHTEFYPLHPKLKSDGKQFEILKSNWSDKNQSKFAQPDVTVKLPKDFLFFPCQIPHDESIKYHSEVSAVEALRLTCEFAIDKNIDLVIKPHPISPASMQSQHDVYIKYVESKRIHWVEKVSIHQCLKECDSVFLVNSGTGLEAILYEKPIFTYGKADYSAVTYNAMDAQYNWSHRHTQVEYYKGFIDAYYEAHYNINDNESFNKLEKYNAVGR